MKATTTELENVMASVKRRANTSMTFTEFSNWAWSLNYKPFMSRDDFGRLISKYSSDAGLDNTD